MNHKRLTGFVRVRVRLATTNGMKERTCWAEKKSPGVYRVWVNTPNGAQKTNELILGAPADIVWEKPAVYDLHYDEIALEEV